MVHRLQRTLGKDLTAVAFALAAYTPAEDGKRAVTAGPPPEDSRFTYYLAAGERAAAVARRAPRAATSRPHSPRPARPGRAKASRIRCLAGARPAGAMRRVKRSRTRRPAVTETVDWQRHQAAYLAQLLASGARPAAIVPGVPRHGEDVGRWLAVQRRNCDRLNEKQQRRLAALGMKEVPRARRRRRKLLRRRPPGRARAVQPSSTARDTP
ncbi:helicase associated domain-containing protein [Streptomyces erythrochromogenes]|uniref:helicase associated domain-containing protein n=1 Tax=Streptomyces erythrochromogenes TaxID=285574 RepID=UPI0036AE1E50